MKNSDIIADLYRNRCSLYGLIHKCNTIKNAEGDCQLYMDKGALYAINAHGQNILIISDSMCLLSLDKAVDEMKKLQCKEIFNELE